MSILGKAFKAFRSSGAKKMTKAFTSFKGFGVNAYRGTKIGMGFTGIATGAVTGGYVGGAPGAVGGAIIGGISGYSGIPVAKRIGSFAFKHPRLSFTVGLGATSA